MGSGKSQRKIEPQHGALLKAIYSTSIQVMNGAIQTRDTKYLSIVVPYLEKVVQRYNKKDIYERALTQ